MLRIDDAVDPPLGPVLLTVTRSVRAGIVCISVAISVTATVRVAGRSASGVGWVGGASVA